VGTIGHTATLLPNGKVLVAGGTAASNGRAAELFDAPSGTWSFTGYLNTPHSGHTATLLPDGKVLVAGGVNDETASAELYDSVTGTWTVTGA
jgi:WD40 repeat protein